MRSRAEIYVYKLDNWPLLVNIVFTGCHTSSADDHSEYDGSYLRCSETQPKMKMPANQESFEGGARGVL
jgi:hypothetical protein